MRAERHGCRMKKLQEYNIDVKQEMYKTLVIIWGTFVYAVGVNLFVVPAGLYTGGFMGIAQVIRTLLIEYTKMPLQNFDIAGILYYLINLPLMLLAFRKIGKKFFVKTIVSVTTMTFFLSIIPVKALLADDILAQSLIGAIISGYGIGIILKMGGSSAGMDIVGIMMVKSRWNLSVGRANLFVNVILYAVCLFLFDVPIVIYSLIFAAVHSIAIDRVHAQNINVEVTVITKKNCPELEEEIFNELGRGITKWNATGAYTEEQSQVLYIMISKYEEHELRTIIGKYDPTAFIVVNEGVSVFGHFLKKL